MTRCNLYPMCKLTARHKKKILGKLRPFCCVHIHDWGNVCPRRRLLFKGKKK